MTDKQTLAEQLLTRFRGVPKVDMTDCKSWIERSMREHDYAIDQKVKPEDARLILAYAEYDGTQQIALRTAHYFAYTDLEERVNKVKVSEQYRIMAARLLTVYERMRRQDTRGNVRFTIGKRADRRGQR
ncbi:hypothetical protein [Jeotgalibacillus aurantiacus]|uniref:hypothetical protein n=1 Tax=Jeotgalibacillus aurantiacus TaxID=2763266 RepID=UPI001D0A6456|nr:hypothetical protein [Jeotgalibacillus aurantiacus]